MDRLGDTVGQLALRLTDRDMTAIAVASRPLNELFEKLAQNNLFWYERAQQLLSTELEPRLGADWRNIYRSLADYRSQKNGLFQVGGDVNALLVFIEVYGTSLIGLDLKEIRSPEVFSILIDMDMKELELKKIIESEIKEGRADSALAMLALVQEKGPVPSHVGYGPDQRSRVRSYTERALDDAVQHGNVEVIKAISAEDPELLTSSWLVALAVKSNEPSSLKYLLAHGHTVGGFSWLSDATRAGADRTLDFILEMQPTHPQNLLNEYTNRDGHFTSNVLRVLLKHGLKLTTAQWKTKLNEAIRQEQLDMIRLALEHVNPDTPKNQVLMYAFKQAAYKSARVILEDKRVDPNKNLLELLREGTMIDEKTLLLLTKSGKINLDALGAPILGALYTQLEYSLENEHIVDGFTEELFVNPPDEYWRLARFLLLKKPTAEQTLEYMRDLDSTDIYLAARTIFDPTLKYPPEAMLCFRALILFLVYPKMSVEESTRHLREDGYSERSIRESNLLIGLVKR